MAAEPSVSSSEDTQRVEESPQSRPGIMSKFFNTRLDEDVRNHQYSGKGTAAEPYVIDFLQNDSQDPLNMSMARKWTITALQATSALVVTFASSIYASSIFDIKRHFDVSEEVATLGLALYVLGFALGPLIWGPLSELYGRRPIYIISFMAFTAFSVAAPVSPNITALLLFRFFGCAFGSSSMTNGGGVITDMLTKEQRGAAMGAFVTAPFLGPALGRWSISLLLFHTACLLYTGYMLILDLYIFRSHCWWFPRREQGMALGSRFSRHHGRCGLDCHYNSNSRNICAVSLTISSKGSLSVDGKRLCITTRRRRAAQNTPTGALSRSLTPLGSSVSRTHHSADVSAHVDRIRHAIHVLCGNSHRFPRHSWLERRTSRTPVCRRHYWRLSCHGAVRCGQ